MEEIKKLKKRKRKEKFKKTFHSNKPERYILLKEMKKYSVA